MEKLSKWFLKQNAQTVFLLSFLGIPFYLWLYSIVTEFDIKNLNKNNFRKYLIKFLTFYPIIYLPFSIVYIFYNIATVDKIGFERIFPFHFAAIFCGLILLILSSGSLTKYEETRKYETFGRIGNFFLLWFYIFGIWLLQPKINKYAE